MSGNLRVFWVCMLMGLSLSIAWAADPGVILGSSDDLVVEGTGGSATDPDVRLYGYVSLGTNSQAAQIVTNGVGSAFIQNQLELGSNFFARGRVNIGPADQPDALLSVATNAFQVNDTGDIVRVRSIPYSWPTNQGDVNTVLQNDGSGSLRWGITPMVITMHAATNAQWLNMPSVLTEFGGMTNSCQTFADLSQFSQFRMTAAVSFSGTAASQLGAQFSTNRTTWFFLDGVTNPLVSGMNSGLKVSGWRNLTNTAKSDVYLRIVGTNGNGTVDPRFGVITVQFK